MMRVAEPMELAIRLTIAPITVTLMASEIINSISEAPV
jgi:hypothetical protein